MAGVESTGARHVVIQRAPTHEEPIAREVIAAVRDSDTIVALSDIDVSPKAISGIGLLTILCIISVAWYLRGRRAGTQQAIATFEKSGRRGPRSVVNRQRVPTDYRALRKSRPIIPKPDLTREIYVRRPLPDPIMHPSGRDQPEKHPSPASQENPL